jgi:hypothetical protein
VLTATGGVSGPTPALSFANLGNFLADEWTLLHSGTGSVQVAFTPIPEPATVLGLAAGALGLCGAVRRLRRGRPAVRGGR